MADSDLGEWIGITSPAAKLSNSPAQAAAATIGKHLHCAEFWMPGPCNLRCRHCYVASSDRQDVMSPDDYYKLTKSMVGSGFIDIVVPGMEPLLRDELWHVLQAAGDAGARSVGMTTNATLLSRHAARLHESALTVLNVSLDGPEAVHDSIRGKGVFRLLKRGMIDFRALSGKRMLTNTTLHRENAPHAAEIAAIATDLGVDYSAFHPFETADEAENELAINASKVADAYEALLDAVRDGRCGSLVLEAEASNMAAIIELCRRGVIDDCHAVIDEAGFIFLRVVFGSREVLVSLTFYPHHFIRTLRVTDSGGLSSCRSMARTAWESIGDLRKGDLSQLLQRPASIAALAHIWQEFQDSFAQLGPGAWQGFLQFLSDRMTLSPFSREVRPESRGRRQLIATAN